ncbi:hypothetical protein MAP00_008378 [Monascus purpureus]|nr:hypothetical protein MAP00_008378 [Monascus purpureus]
MPIKFGGGLYEWKSGAIIALFLSAGVLWIAFSVQQTLLLFTSVTDRMFPSYIYGFKALLGLGGGSFAQAGYTVIQTVVPPEDLGLAIIPKSSSNSAILKDNGRFSSAVLVS